MSNSVSIIVRYEEGPLAGQFDAYCDPGFGPAPMIPRNMVKGVVTSEDGRPFYVVPEYRLERQERSGGWEQYRYVFVRELGRMELQPSSTALASGESLAPDRGEEEQ